MDGPIYVYYQLDNFYQNHRRYVSIRFIIISFDFNTYATRFVIKHWSSLFHICSLFDIIFELAMMSVSLYSVGI